MKQTVLRRMSAGLLLVFVLINLFFYASAKWNADHIPGMAKWRVLSVLTGSMAPTLHPGDMIIIERYGANEPQPGEIVSFWEDEAHRSLVTHRIVQRLHNGYLQTKGDANAVRDGGWTAPERVVGKVIVVLPYAARAQELLQKPTVLMMLIAGLLASGMYARKKQRHIKMGEIR